MKIKKFVCNFLDADKVVLLVKINLLNLKFIIPVSFTAISFCSFRHEHARAEAELAMQKYDSLLKTMNAEAISEIFTSDGRVGDVAQERHAIKNFLSSFVNVKELSQRSGTSSIELKGNSPIQTGMYFQTAVIDGKDTSV